MLDSGHLRDPANTTQIMRRLVLKTSQVAERVHLLFVTNLQSEDVSDVGADGLSNEPQYYTRRQADGIIRGFQNLGVTVESFFTEIDFIEAVMGRSQGSGDKQVVVYSTAEAGRGSGRRALIPALCNLLSLPMLNSGPHASSIARHKFHANAVLQQVGIRTPGTWQFVPDGWSTGMRPPPGSKVIVKPMYESMCIGVDDASVAVVDSGFETFLGARAASLRQPLLVQEFISGEEVTVPLVRLGYTHAFPVVAYRRRNGDPFGSSPRTFRSETVERDYSYVLYDAPHPQYERLVGTALDAFDALELRGVGRMDFRIDADGRAWLIDTNESPPPLEDTSYATSVESLGFSVQDMLGIWLGVALVECGLIQESDQ